MRWRQWLCLLVLVAIGGAVRLWHLGDASFSVGEVHQVVAADRPLAAVPAAVAEHTGATPLVAIVSRSVLRRWGRTETVLRAPSALVGAATIAALFAAGQTLFGRPPWLATALLAVSASHVAASREVEAAAWGGLLTISLLTVARQLLREPTGRAWLRVAAIGTAALYAHYGAVLVWAALLLVTLACLPFRTVRARAAGSLLLAALSGFVLFTPWLWLDAQAERGAVMFIPTISLDTFARIGRAFATADRQVPALWAALLAGAAAAGVIRGMVAERPASALVATTLAAAIGGTLLATYRLPYPFDPHQVLFVLPPYLLLCGRGLEWPVACARERLRPWLHGTLAVVAGGVGLWVLRAPALSPAPDWRAVSAVVGNNAWSDDAVAAPQLQEILAFYAPALSRQLLPQRPATVLVEALARAPRGWLVAPLSVRLSAAWPELARWATATHVIDLSAGEDPLILYGGEASRGQLLHEVAGFDLPAAALARGILLRELLQLVGPYPIVLRFIDQLAAAEPQLPRRNPELLSVISLLADSGQRDRAHALAVRLAESDPDWVEAQQAVAALE